MKTTNGFTLLELLVIIAIAAILMTIAMPNFTAMIKGNRLTSHFNDFIAAINLGRSESIRRNRVVTMCAVATSTSTTCTTGWETGWIVFVDYNGDTIFDAGTDELIRRHELLSGSGVTLRGSGDTNTYISYASNGTSRASDGSLLSGELVLCDDRGFGTDAKAIALLAGGHPSLRTVAQTTLTTCN